MTRPIVIGIHGLKNKPSKAVLEPWWKDALREGLRRNHGEQHAELDFGLAYWADVRNSAPIPLDQLEESYVELEDVGPLRRYESNSHLERARTIAQKWGGRAIDKAKDLVETDVAEKLLSVTLEDLGDYYEDPAIRNAIRERLAEMLRANRGRRILLVSHSMGSIIAHDVLRMAEDDPDLRIEHWITIGSPLGLPLVAEKIRDEFGEQRTPGNVDRWSNLADPGDKVALDCDLRDDFREANGVRVEDDLLHNDYVNHQGEPNCHKSYGYLRAPELSDRVRSFLVT